MLRRAVEAVEALPLRPLTVFTTVFGLILMVSITAISTPAFSDDTWHASDALASISKLYSSSNVSSWPQTEVNESSIPLDRLIGNVDLPADSQQETLSIKGGCANVEAYTTGRWMPRTPTFVSTNEIGFFKPGEGDCAAVYGTRNSGHSKDESNQAEMERLVAVSNWEWIPEYCPIRRRGTEDWAAYLLRMPSGIVFVGDSLSGQQMRALFAMFGGEPVDGQPLLLNNAEEGRQSLPNTASYWLNPEHPTTKALSQKYPSDWFQERLKWPVITQWWTSHLVSNEILGPLIAENGGSSTVGRSRTRYPDYKPREWIRGLNQLAQMYDDALPEGVPSYVRTAIIINSGPHWTNYHIEGLSTKHPLDNVLKAYRGVVKNVTASLAAIPHSAERVRPIYRTNVFTPRPCNGYKHPVDDLRQAPRTTASFFPIWPQFDQAWKEYGAGILEILNTTYITGLRPEARRDPDQGDCLHVCLPIAQTFNDVLWSTMF